MNGCHPNIFLVGYMGSGKTTVGKALAGHLGRDFVDMDMVIESEHNMPISRMFMKFGEHHFRNLEAELFDKITGRQAGASGGDTQDRDTDYPLQNTVVSCGGGIVLDDENRKVLSDEFVIWLDCDPGIMFERIKDNANLPNAYFHIKDEKERARIFERQYEQRRKLYEEVADLKVSTASGDIRDIIADINRGMDNKI